MNVQITDSSGANGSASAAGHMTVIMCRESKSRIARIKNEPAMAGS
jgi:hypothetical protein